MAIIRSAVYGHNEKEKDPASPEQRKQLVSDGQKALEATPGFPAVKKFIIGETKNLMRRIFAGASYIGYGLFSFFAVMAPAIVVQELLTEKFPGFLPTLNTAGLVALVVFISNLIAQELLSLSDAHVANMSSEPPRISSRIFFERLRKLGSSREDFRRKPKTF